MGVQGPGDRITSGAAFFEKLFGRAGKSKARKKTEALAGAVFARSIQDVHAEVRRLTAADITSPAKLKITLSALGALKEELGEFKAGKVTGQSDAAHRQSVVTPEGVLHEIEKHIVDLGSTLEGSDAVAVSDSARGTIEALIDPDFETRWAQVTNWQLFMQPVLKNEADNPSILPAGLIAKENMRRAAPGYKPTMLDDAYGNRFEVPEQFSKDLHRMLYFLVNGKIEYSAENTSKSPTEAYKSLFQLCEQKKGEKEGVLLATRITSIINQGLMADMVAKIQAVHSPDSEHIMYGSGSGQIWSVEIENDTVKIMLKLSMALKDPSCEISDPAEKSDPSYGAVLAKREITIPIESLLNADSQDQTLELAGIDVVDTYSRRIQSPAYAEILLPGF